VIDPFRDEVPGFAVTLYETCPLPLPLEPPVIVIQDVLVVAFHAQPLPAVTDTFAEPAVAPSVAVVGERPKVQAAASWVTVNARPATVSVPVRWLVVVFAATEYPTEPFPLPFAPDVTVIQDAELDAVQLHPEVVVTATMPVFAVAATDVPLGEIE
jgi:hypothetical protein